MKDIKRRSFLKSIVGGIVALFVGVPKAKAIVKKPLQSDIYSPNNPNSKIKWRKFNPPEKRPEAYTQEDIDAAFIKGNHWTDEQVKKLAEQQQKTMDELCINVIKDGTRR